jgi:hypothetical protein
MNLERRRSAQGFAPPTPGPARNMTVCQVCEKCGGTCILDPFGGGTYCAVPKGENAALEACADWFIDSGQWKPSAPRPTGLARATQAATPRRRALARMNLERRMGAQGFAAPTPAPLTAAPGAQGYGRGRRIAALIKNSR